MSLENVAVTVWEADECAASVRTLNRGGTEQLYEARIGTVYFMYTDLAKLRIAVDVLLQGVEDAEIEQALADARELGYAEI